MHLYRRDASGALARAVPSLASSSLSKGVQDIAAKLAHTPSVVAALLSVKQTLLLQKREARISSRATAIIDLIICIVSVLGAISIIIPYVLNRRSRKLRHALILGLATSDLVSSLIIIATSAVPIAGGSLTADAKFCTFAGYAFAVAIWTEHLWNLSIAVITYMILVFPMSSFVNNVERHIIWLWPLFWGIAMIVNGAAWAHTGFADVGGYCSFNPAIAGADFAAAFLFVPRGIVVLVIIVLYTHLFFFLRRTNLFNQVTHSSSRVTGSRGPGAQSEAIFPSRRESEGNMLDQFGEEQYEAQPAPKHRSSTASTIFGKVKRRFSAPGPVHAAEEVPDSSSSNGDSSKRTGSSSTQGNQSTFAPTLNMNDMPRNVAEEEKSTTDRSPKDVSAAPLPADVAVAPSTQQPSTPLSGIAALRRGSAPLPEMYGRRQSTTFMTIPEAHALAEKREPSVPGHKSNIVPPSILRESGSTRFNTRDKGPRDEPATDEPEDDDDDDESLPGADLYRPMQQRRDVRDFGMTSAPQEHLRHYSLNPARVRQMSKENGHTADDSEEKGRGMDLQDILNETQDAHPGAPNEGATTYDNVMSDDWSWGMAVASPPSGRPKKMSTGEVSDTRASSNAGTHNTTLRQLHGRRKSKGRKWGRMFTRGNDRRHSESEAGATSTSSSDEHGVESLGSTLNRQASVLLLLYPGVYCLLFSISIIRIIVDLTSDLTPEQARARQNNALHEISRWTIFAQGFIDAFVFQLIERHFRSRMKRRRRIAAGELVEDLWHSKVWKAMKRMQSRRSSAAAPTEEKA